MWQSRLIYNLFILFSPVHRWPSTTKTLKCAAQWKHATSAEQRQQTIGIYFIRPASGLLRTTEAIATASADGKVYVWDSLTKHWENGGSPAAASRHASGKLRPDWPNRVALRNRSGPVTRPIAKCWFLAQYAHSGVFQIMLKKYTQKKMEKEIHFPARLKSWRYSRGYVTARLICAKLAGSPPVNKRLPETHLPPGTGDGVAAFLS